MDIGHHTHSKVFDLHEARELLPLIRKISTKSFEQLETLEHKLNRLLLADLRRQPYQERYKWVITRWKTKMESLGVVVEGLWQVRFDVGDGYLCWQHPDASINHFLAANEPWDNREPLQGYIALMNPDWAFH